MGAAPSLENVVRMLESKPKSVFKQHKVLQSTYG